MRGPATLSGGRFRGRVRAAAVVFLWSSRRLGRDRGITRAVVNSRAREARELFLLLLLMPPSGSAEAELRTSEAAARRRPSMWMDPDEDQGPGSRVRDERGDHRFFTQLRAFVETSPRVGALVQDV